MVGANAAGPHCRSRQSERGDAPARLWWEPSGRHHTARAGGIPNASATRGDDALHIATTFSCTWTPLDDSVGNRNRFRQSCVSLIARPSMIHPGFRISLCASASRLS